MSTKKLVFHEFPSIERMRPRVLKDFKSDTNQWICMEKVHGANFSFITNGKQIECCRRNALLAEHETFYNFQTVREKYKNAIFGLFDSIQKMHEAKVDQIQVYGELFGGIYPHEKVEDLGLLHVQKGVYYCPHIELMVFDIFVTSSGKSYWMNYDQAMKLFESHKLFYAKPLFTGTLEECFKFDIKINSTIPKLLGLPELPKNQCEGIVIKSVQPVFKNNKRVIFKKKNERFAEVNPKVPMTLYEKRREEKLSAIEKAYSILERYINNNRMETLQSKIGPVTKENMKMALELFCEDVFKDFCEDEEKLWKLLDEDTQERIRKNTKSKVNSFVSNWLNSEN